MQQWTQEFSGTIRQERGGGIGRGWDEDGGGARDWTTQGAMSLRVARTVDLAYWTDIPLTMDANMSEVMTFEA